MESPHHGAPDPGSHPRIATEAAHPGAGSRRCRCRNPDVRGGVLTHVVRCDETPRGRANEGSMEIKTLPATLVSVCLRGFVSFHYCREIHSNPAKPLSANDKPSPRTRGLYLGDVNEKASGRIPEELLLVLRHKMAAMRDSTHRGLFLTEKDRKRAIWWVDAHKCLQTSVKMYYN